MTTARLEDQTPPHTGFDPEEYRMTVGEHLEELRRRLIFGFIGLFVAVIVCMLFGERIVVSFCRPLYFALQKRHINPQLYYREVAGAFMTYLKISLITALAFSGPWILYQIWQFVAAGLYPNERKALTRYIPLSIGLLILGMVFVYVVVLPLTIGVLLDFGNTFPIPQEPTKAIVQDPTTHPTHIDQFDGDPDKPSDGQIWYNKLQGRLKVFLEDDTRILTFGSKNLVAPMIELSTYIDLVITSMLTFGICFQLPIVVMTVVKIGIVDVAGLKKSRRIVYFVMSIVAAFLAPGDVVTAMMALLVPLIMLYEFGIYLAMWSVHKSKAAAS